MAKDTEGGHELDLEPDLIDHADQFQVSAPIVGPGTSTLDDAPPHIDHHSAKAIKSFPNNK
jgi:hypothetical protein